MELTVARKRMGQVLQVDSINSDDSDFLATHVPFRRITVSQGTGPTANRSQMREEDIYRQIFDDEMNADKHQLIIVEGSSGAGKSHFIRWINAMLSTRPEAKDVVLLIRRSDNTLKGTIRQLLNIEEIKKLSDHAAYERLVKANKTISEQKFKTTIYHTFIVEIKSDETETLSGLKRKRLIALLENEAFEERLMASGGPIERIYTKITNTENSVDLDTIAQFERQDLMIDMDFIETELEYADRNAKRCAEDLVKDEEFVQTITDYLNSFVEEVIQSSAGIESGDFEQIFREIRQELKRQGKDLILLIEDITSFTGVNQALLNALVVSHTGSNAADDMCRLVSLVGTTSEYYRQFRDNYSDRITSQITIHEGAIGDNKDDLFQFAGRYLNAMSLESSVLEEWRKNGAAPDSMPIHSDKNGEEWGYYALDKDRRLSLYPFTKNSLVNLYDAMPRQKTPRYILRYIIEPAVNDIIKNTFPSFCTAWRTGLSEAVENRINVTVFALKNDNSSDSTYCQRLIALIGFWSDKTINVAAGQKIGGLSRRIFDELGFTDFADDVLKNTSVSQDITEIQEEAAPASGLDEAEPKAPADPAALKRQQNYDRYYEMVKRWHWNKEKLVNFQKIRDEINEFIYNTINWQQEGVPLLSAKMVHRSAKQFVAFERQDQAIEKGLILIKDDEQGEAYQLLLCFGKWVHLGEKSWNFEDAASSAFYATSWLERNKSKFIEAARGTKKDDIPAFVKAAMMTQMYKLILNGNFGRSSINDIRPETLLAPDIKRKAPEMLPGHSKEWHDLLRLIFEDPCRDESYSAAVRYFNLILGDAVNSPIYNLNYTLLQKALKELRASQLTLDEIAPEMFDDSIKDKKAIYDYCVKILQRIHVTAQSELTIAEQTLEELTGFFDNFDTDDEFEPSDISTMLVDIGEFYTSAYSAGVNLSYPSEKIAELKKKTRAIADAIAVLQKDHSRCSDTEILIDFSPDPIGTILPFMELLRRSLKDSEVVITTKNEEKERLERSGVWKNQTDGRFDERRDAFEQLYKRFKEV